MAKTDRERQDDKRDQQLETIRQQIASGDLTVRQMTPEERARWDKHSARSARHLPPEESARRSAALKHRARVQEMRRTRPRDS
jgi:hypothetical protein